MQTESFTPEQATPPEQPALTPGQALYKSLIAAGDSKIENQRAKLFQLLNSACSYHGYPQQDPECGITLDNIAIARCLRDSPTLAEMVGVDIYKITDALVCIEGYAMKLKDMSEAEDQESLEAKKAIISITRFYLKPQTEFKEDARTLEQIIDGDVAF